MSVFDSTSPVPRSARPAAEGLGRPAGEAQRDSCRSLRRGAGVIRVLHVFSRLDRGGAELAMVELMRDAAPHHFQFHFAALSGRDGELASQIRRQGGHVHALAVRQRGFGLQFQALVRQRRIDIVQSHVHRASGLILRLAARAGVPGRIAFFHSPHDGRRAGPGRWLYRAVTARWIRRHATAVLANSRATMAAVWGRRWDRDPRFEVLYLGVRTQPLEAVRDRAGVCREFGIDRDAPLVVHVGRMTEAKNHLRLIALFAAVRRLQPQARLLLAGRGGGPIERQVRREVARRGLDAAVVFCGQRQDVLRLVASADAMLFPSRWEGLGLAVLEACSVGTPVVASDLPCFREIAAQLPGVHCLSLGWGDPIWAEALVAQAVPGPSEAARRQAQSRFRGSPFHFPRSLERAGRLWRDSLIHAGCRGETDG